MNDAQMPVVKDLVLIGGGHTHVLVLRRFGMKRMPGVRLTVIARDIHTPYSGMLPGFIAGHYNFDDIHIDLAPLSRFAGARLYHDEAIGLDLENRKVLCQNRPPVSFDVLSIDIGATPVLDVPGAGEHATPVKPIGSLLDRWKRLTVRVLAAERSLQIGTVGAGAAGVEVTLAMQYALSRLLAEHGRADCEPQFHLFSAAESILPTHGWFVRTKFHQVLRERGVQLHFDSAVSSVSTGEVQTSQGEAFAIDELIWATEAGTQRWPVEAGLDTDEKGFIRVDDTLQSTSHPGVFAVGDVAAVVNHPREKAGVFAVRQGKPLEANLRRALVGEPLEPFTPQRKFLSLITTGDRYAIASRGHWSVAGAWAWTWKDWIDRRFMTKFRDLPTMESGSVTRDLERLVPAEAVSELSTAAMRCAGCGSKVGAAILDRVLARLAPVRPDDVVLGLEGLDDASVERLPPGKVAVRTIDEFRAIVDDPFIFGKITANHCLGDIYAMGAEPRTALAVATIPLGTEAKMEELLEELLTGAVDVLNTAGAGLVGGHTTEGAELTLGLSLSGIVDPDQILRKAGMQAGDRLVMTKPIGTGTLFAAHMQLHAKGRWVDGAIRSMLQSSRDASVCLRRHGATACTDVTGFGLLGHLVEMAKASAVDVQLTLSAIPLLDGTRETIAAGFLSSLQPQNFRLRRAVANVEEAAAGEGRYLALFDPQTAGGLLASVPAEHAALCVAELRMLGYKDAAVIGSVEPSSNRSAPIWIDV